jgi:nucleotide-binding universal stress UspA family protein
MKKILVAIDFSDCSVNALEHAITIANKAKAQILMVWVNKPEGTRDIFTEGPETLTSMVTDRFEELMDKYQGEADQPMVFKIREGSIYKEIVKESEDHDVEMLVVGTHGASGFEEFWIGSNAYRIVSSVAKPVLTIRGGVDISRELNKIVLPIDSSMETRQKVPFTAYVAGLFGAEVYILSVYTTKVMAIQNKVDGYSEQVMKHLEEENIKYQLESILTDNVTTGTIEFAEGIDANMIAIMTEQEKTTKNLWLGPYAQQMVNHSPIPVLSVHPKEFLISLAR